MQSIVNICGILIGLYCLYYQTVFVIFNNLTRNSQAAYKNVFLKETLPQVLIIIICLIFLFLNIRALIIRHKEKRRS